MARRLASPLLALTLVVAACGGGDDATSVAPATAPAAAETPPALASPTVESAPTAAVVPTSEAAPPTSPPAAADAPTAEPAAVADESTGEPVATAEPTAAPASPPLEEGVERPDLVTFAQGAVPAGHAVDGPGEGLGTRSVIQAIDGLRTPRIFVSGATDDTTIEMTFELAAATTFDRFAVPDVLEVPSPSVTFFRAIEVLGSAEGPDTGFVTLAAATLTTHDRGGDITELDLAPQTPVRYLQIRLSGGIEILQDQSGLQFSELIGNGTQDTVALLDGFTGIWDAKLADIDRSIGLVELTQDGAVVTGCFGSSDLSGSVSGNIARLTGIDRSDGTRSAYIFGLASDGSLQGVISNNGGPFGFVPTTIAPEGSTTECSDVPEPEYALGCGSIIHGINFDFDSATLRPESEPVLQQLFEGLGADDAASITIEGHTSTEGSDSYNADLAARRAQSVVDDLVARGIDPGRLLAVGKGESEPLITPDDDEAARSINRRVEVDCT